ncbi:MAG: hypothetical protein CR988_08405 [Treponema sp.]|nr:MAG: hypothetical protein CR988_08405 [Treponema sp.]
MKIFVPYPDIEEEISIVNQFSSFTNSQKESEKKENKILSLKDLEKLRRACEDVKCAKEITKYIVSIVAATRPLEESKKDEYVQGSYLSYILYGASPRATIAIQKCAKIKAMFEGRDFVIPEDVKAVAHAALRHRLKLSYEAAADSLSPDDIISKLLDLIPQP